MSQSAMANPNSSRAIALQRRKALSSGGKAAMKLAGSNAGSSGGASGSAASASRSISASAGSSGAGGSARAASLARRKAMSTQGKAAVDSKDRVRADTMQNVTRPTATANASQTGERKGCGCGCNGTKVEECVNRDRNSRAGNKGSGSTVMKSRASVASRPQIAANPAKSAALARRKALSTLGKAGMNAQSKNGAQTARASNPNMSSRELAKALRNERSKNGKAGQNNSASVSPQSQSSPSSVGAAQDASWKVGASTTVSGQTVTGSMVGRQQNMTGDEPGTCRAITGTEYLGSDIFNKFCVGSAVANPRKVEVTSTSRGNQISGNRMGRGSNVTGNEHATCKRITGDEYTSSEESKEFCESSPTKAQLKGSMAQTMKGKTVTGTNVGRSENVTGNEYGQRRRLTGTQYTRSENLGFAPAKVGFSTTIRGGDITGTMVGRGERVTGNKHSTCRNITGDDYIGREQFGTYCKSTPDATDSKIAVSQTLAGLKVTGDLAQRSRIVTGDEPGTCKAMTGTPYSGADQYENYCDASQAEAARARMQPSGRTFGKPMTGLQPGIGGKLTGAGKGACEPISGTPYVGSDQAASACPAIPAEPGSADYPQALGSAPWGNFSVNAPIHAAQHDGSFSHVTGSRYESGLITGSFGKGGGKLTGTEEARFDRQQSTNPMLPATAQMIDGRVKSRVTGEGMESGLKITGDDWDRGDHVTGTEGASATQRNLTRRGGGMSAMQMRKDMTRPEDIPVPVSKVTGGSGNTEKGALITYSGGARG